jgi:glycosyltransferase involved in cell wall biosynthesis
MRVLISAYACNAGGDLSLHPGEDLVGWQIASRIARNHEVWVLTEMYNKAKHDVVPPNMHIVYVRIPVLFEILYKVDFLRRVYYYLWQVKAYFVGRSLHKKFNFDIVHHLTFGNDWMPSFVGAFLGKPFLWGPIGGGQKTPKPLRKEYTLIGNLKEFVRDFAQFVGRHFLISRKLTAKRAKKILVCNEETKRCFPQELHHKIDYFPVNGLSEEEFQFLSQRNKQEGEPFRILTAGRLHRLKGFGLVIKAFARFKERVGEAPCELVIVGDGEEKKNLTDLAKGLGVKNSVKFLGWLSREKLLEEYTRADVFVFLSFRDGGGAVVVEAMGAGLPVVALKSGGPGFHVGPGWGFLVEPDEPHNVVEKTAEILELLYKDENLRVSLGKKARERVKEYYLWEKLADRIENYYREILEE